MDSFFGKVHSFLSEVGLLNAPNKLYNIDETWYSQNEDKRKKVLVPTENRMPYKAVPGKQDHITMAMCSSAEGRWLPPMFIYKGSLPTNDEFHSSGPDHAIYKSTESGHIDSITYLEYIQHLDKYLNQERLIAIFHYNL